MIESALDEFHRLLRVVATFFRRPKFKPGFQFNRHGKTVTVARAYKAYDSMPGIFYLTDAGYSPSQSLIEWYLDNPERTQTK